MSQSPSLRLDLKPSPILAGALALVHGLALAAAAAVLAGWPLALVAAGVALSGAATVAEALQRTPAAARALELHADGRAAWLGPTGHWHEGVLLPERVVTPALIVLALKAGARRRKHIVLAADASDRESLRRLRAWLRWRPPAARDPVAEA
ncbi:MAG TPA: protein YgfX [Burkholderiales bacterium]|nr:protein YgfX [Burkholderiales bacterium]